MLQAIFVFKAPAKRSRVDRLKPIDNRQIFAIFRL
jgi:hypothetical protein